jgi:hypothetical protein
MAEKSVILFTSVYIFQCCLSRKSNTKPNITFLKFMQTLARNYPQGHELPTSVSRMSSTSQLSQIRQHMLQHRQHIPHIRVLQKEPPLKIPLRG